MNTFQCTILNKGTISGVGLHTGKVATLKFLPEKINFGIKFQRIDIVNKPIIKADVDNVIEVERGTTISENNGKVSTIEHLLAALVGLQIDNILIQIDGPEVPIMDGSSFEFVNALKNVKSENKMLQENILKYLIAFLIKMKKIMLKFLPIRLMIIESQ
jgi:UDP-3-O-[3-hydroxymyristoyl] N-acetylglucosamine deacetylase/3-hydroxyacyl-[acyl-carrier-protein] dehydratase